MNESIVIQMDMTFAASLNMSDSYVDYIVWKYICKSADWSTINVNINQRFITNKG